MRFDNSGVKPECPIYVEEGVVFLTSAMTPANIRIGKNGFIRYDLVGITDTSAEDQTLAEGVTITLDDGETLAEHVLICNNGSLKWQAYLDGTTLKAKNMTSETATTTIWTFRSGNKWFGNAQNWTCGVPSPTVKTIIPFATTITQGDDNFQCGDVILKTEGTLKIETDYYNKGQNKNFRATSISGDGVVDISVHYLEPNPGAPCNVNVPLTISNQQYGNNIKGHDATAVFNINDSLTLPVNQTCTVENFVNINGDLVVDGTITFNNSQTLKGAIAGGGTIAGSFTTAAGATLTTTITDADGTAECLTVTGNADLSNADVEILGGELLAEAADVTEIILLKASGTITWSKKSYVIPGQDEAWTIKTDTWTDEDTSTTYNILKAVKSKPGFVIIVQ